jgi:hypothetical protein
LGHKDTKARRRIRRRLPKLTGWRGDRVWGLGDRKKLKVKSKKAKLRYPKGMIFFMMFFG